MQFKQLNNFECPNCGGIMESKDAGTLECPYCGSRFRDNSAPAPAAKPVAPKPVANAPKDPRHAQVLAQIISEYVSPPKSKNVHALIGKDAVAGDSFRYSRAKAKMGIPDNAVCYLLYSDLYFGFNKGLALCDTGVYCCPELDQPMQFSWAEFAKLPLSLSHNKLYLGDTGIYIFDETDPEKMLIILGRIQEKL